MAKTKPRRPRLLLAVDPGENAGVAVFFDNVLMGYAPSNGAKWEALVSTMLELSEFFIDQTSPEERLCLIEDGFGRGLGAKTLDRRRGKAEAAAEACGFPKTVYVYPGTWQTQTWGPLAGRNTKQLSLDTCTAMFCKGGEPMTDHNISDAILLGSWAVLNLTL